MEHKKRILVVDDEADLCDILLYNLHSAGYDAVAAYSAEDALLRLPPSDEPLPDLLMLDVMMPGMSGFELAARLRADALTATIPIIFLTAKDSEDDTLQGFALGADDYVTKPFSPREVMARVRAVLNRAQPADATASADTLVYEGLCLDHSSKTVTVDGTPVAMTPTEFNLLAVLLTRQRQVHTREELIKLVWPDDVIVSGRTVDVNITRLRKKIGPYAANIATRQGFGYVFEEVKSEK